MLENNINIAEIKNEIKRLKLEILEKENKVDELLNIIFNENNEEFEKTEL